MLTIAGMMSGTSADGVDVAMIDVAGRGAAMTATLIKHHAHPYDAALRERIVTIRDSPLVTLENLMQLGRDITLAYAEAFHAAISSAKLTATRVAAIAAHGQTLYHAPPLTLQWLDPALLAACTRRPVINDFRRADCAVGGQGAPLVPFADYLLFRNPKRSRVLLNIGGIANLTHLSAGATLDAIKAFDTGPGNCISDFLCRNAKEPRGHFDVGGSGALRGHACEEIVSAFMAGPYVAKPAPKSTDGPEMIEAFVKAAGLRLAPLPLNDQLATAAVITARTVFAAVGSLSGGAIDELIVSGGGTENAAIMQQLTHGAPAAGIGSIVSADAFGVPSQAKEAMAFALLGAATLDNEPSNIPSATGASRRVVLGSITPAS